MIPICVCACAWACACVWSPSLSSMLKISMLYDMFIPHNKKEREVVVEGEKKRKGEREKDGTNRCWDQHKCLFELHKI